MSPEAVSGAAQSRRRRPSCCSLSCLGCLVLLLLLGLGGWYFWRQAASPWVAAQATRLTERFPWAGNLWRARAALGSLEPGTFSPGELASTDPEDFPADVWLPTAEETTFNISETSALAAVTLPAASSRSLLAQYRTEMSRRGWQRATESELHDGALLVFAKNDRSARVRIFEQAEAVEVWLDVGLSAATPAEAGLTRP